MGSLVIINEGCSEAISSKTAIGLIRYGSQKVAALIDSDRAGEKTDQVFGMTEAIPFVATFEEAFQIDQDIKAAVIGTNTHGGLIPGRIKPLLRQAAQLGLDIYNVLHEPLSLDRELVASAQQSGSRLIEVREPKEQRPYPRYHPHRQGSKTVLTVGSDCCVGKMTTSIELVRFARTRNIMAEMAATGQTGILIVGHGVPVDHTMADYSIGMISYYVAELTKEFDWVIVEGQGSVTTGNIALGLIQGSNPDAVILCHDLSRQKIKNYPHWKIPPLQRLIEIYNEVLHWIREEKPAEVVAVALNTSSLPEAEALQQLRNWQAKLCLPVEDPVRFGAKRLWEAIERRSGDD